MWSSSRPKGWPRHGFRKRGGAIFFGLVATFAAWFVQWQYQWSGMQRYYLAHYVVSSAGWFNKYLVLHTVDRRGKWHPTIPDEVVPVQMASYTRGVIPFRLSDAAIKTGAVKLANPLMAVDKARFAAFLREWVYNGQTLTALAKPGMLWGFGVMIAGVCFDWPQDRKAREVLEHGLRVRGAELVTRDEFNRRRKYRTGVGFLTQERRSLRERATEQHEVLCHDLCDVPLHAFLVVVGARLQAPFYIQLGASGQVRGQILNVPDHNRHPVRLFVHLFVGIRPLAIHRQRHPRNRGTVLGKSGFCIGSQSSDKDRFVHTALSH
jgi:hypothetical protein